MSKTVIPGAQALRCDISDACRRRPTEEWKQDVLDRVAAALDQLDKGQPAGNGVSFHVAVTWQRPEPKMYDCSICGLPKLTEKQAETMVVCDNCAKKDSLTTERDDPGLQETRPDGQQKKYLVLSEEERAQGFVRPVRHDYVHVGPKGPQYDLRDLTDDERERFADVGYVKFEAYPESESPKTGRYWTQEQLDKVGKGCGVKTTMGQAIAETYARDPNFYGSTFCVGCRKHLPVEEFEWDDGSGERVGS